VCTHPADVVRDQVEELLHELILDPLLDLALDGERRLQVVGEHRARDDGGDAVGGARGRRRRSSFTGSSGALLLREVAERDAVRVAHLARGVEIEINAEDARVPGIDGFETGDGVLTEHVGHSVQGSACPGDRKRCPIVQRPTHSEHRGVRATVTDASEIGGNSANIRSLAPEPGEGRSAANQRKERLARWVSMSVTCSCARAGIRVPFRATPRGS
jgi:hypothetical protein